MSDKIFTMRQGDNFSWVHREARKMLRNLLQVLYADGGGKKK